MARSLGTDFDWDNKRCGGSGSVPSFVAISQTFAIGPMGFSKSADLSIVTFNDGIASSEIGSTLIRQMSIGTYDYTFSTDFSYGDASNFNATGSSKLDIRFHRLSDEVSLCVVVPF